MGLQVESHEGVEISTSTTLCGSIWTNLAMFYASVGLSSGPSICIGINFAQVEIKALVSHILRNYTFELFPRQNIFQVYGVTGWPANGIKMNFKPLSQ